MSFTVVKSSIRFDVTIKLHARQDRAGQLRRNEEEEIRLDRVGSRWNGWVGSGWVDSVPVGSAGATCATDNRFATRGLDDARMLDRAV